MVCVSFIFSAEFITNEVDEFTGDTIKQTEYNMIVSSFSETFYMSFKKVNQNYALHLKMMIGILSISEGARLILKLSDNSTITLDALSSEVSCKGCGAPGFVGSGAYGIHQRYRINKEQIKILSSTKVSMIRVYTNKGYFSNDIRERRQDSIKDIASLIIDKN